MNETRTLLILGGDGYLGWTLGLAFGNRTNYRVVLVDNLIKRQWEHEVNAKHLVDFKSPDERIAAYKRHFNKDNILFEKADLLNYDSVEKLIEKYAPSVIINAAQQPSAPFSMMNAKNAAATYQNNVVGNMNVLWAIATVDPTITYIKLGSAGCYSAIDTDFIPLEKIDLHFTHNNRPHTILNTWLPMGATDFYHQSKTGDFLTNDLACKIWGLKILTVQQSTIFGAVIDENEPSDRQDLASRFNYDAVFSTVLNRFVCQAAIEHPLTVYGEGDQVTGVISLRDTVQNFLQFAESEISPGEHRIVHNYTHRLSINDIASLISDASGGQEITHISNPRKEEDIMQKKEVEVDSLIVGTHFKADEKLEKEIAELLTFVKQHANTIDRSIIMPKINWTVDVKTTKKEDSIASQQVLLSSVRSTKNRN